ncbi:TolC family protein [Parabacteroides sp. Marseille-P3160]|uniref:TolC family protein n=1 Tax=Parabacteroides sp. Marseille-P3160 TaxID=1917887 RepID=UPI0009BC6E6A|nr:TolC family protein [Parabacteroides sp. Marseille-P3160]
MKKIILSFIICTTTIVATAQDTTALLYRFTLENCLEYASSFNYNRQSQKLTEKAKEDAYSQSKMERLPNLSASLNESFNSSKNSASSWNGSYGINTNITLYNGGSIGNTIEQNRLMTEQASAQTYMLDKDLTISILQAFLTALGNEELLNYQKSVVKTSEEQLKQGVEQFRLGKILESDYLLLESQYTTDKNNIVETQIAIDKSLLNLKNLLSMSPTDNLQIVSPDTGIITGMSMLPPIDYVLEQASVTLPDLEISKYNVEIAKIGVKLSKANYAPAISLYGNAGTGHSSTYSRFGKQLSDRLNGEIGISVSIPIFDNNRTRSKVNQSRIALQQAELEQKQTELDMMQVVATEYQDVVSAYNKYQTFNVKQQAYFKSFEVYLALFNTGSITAVDMLQQQNNYISALNDFIQSKYEFILKRKILDVYIGNSILM